MKLTTDYDRDQQKALRQRNRLAKELPEKCPCEFLIDRILQGESPAQIHRWALHSQPPKFLKQLIAALSPSFAPHSATGGHSQFSHSATQLWPSSPGAVLPNVGGQFGQFSFDSLERSNKGKFGHGCEHLALFLAIVSAERGGGYFTLLHSWGIPIWDICDGRNQGPLHLAVQRQSASCVQELLQLKPKEQAEEGHRNKKKNGTAISPIHLAAAHRSSRILKILLDYSEENDDEKLEAIVDMEGMSPLHYAAAAGSEQCCELLLGPGIGLPVDLRDNLGRTALHLAAMFKGASNVVRLLIAKKSIGATARDHQGLTPVHVAIIANNRPVLEALLEGMGQNGAAQQIFDHDSRTPLHYSALYDRTELANLLVAQTGATNKTRDRFNVTPAHYAAQCASYETFVAVLGGNNQQQGEEGGWSQLPVDNEGRTPLMWAIVGQNESMVRKMLANKAESNRLLKSRDNFRRNCLHLAALSGGMEMCKFLVEASSSTLNLEVDEKGATAEHLAAGQGNSELVLWFGYQRGHLPPPLDEMDRTPFFYACLGGQVSTIKAMLRSLHIDSVQIDQLGRSALHCAVISGSLNSVKALMESKLEFDANLLDNNSKSAIDLTRQQQSMDILRYFENRE